MWLILLSLFTVQAQTSSLEFIRGLAFAECVAIKNDTWVLYGIAGCDPIVPLVSEKQNQAEVEFYKRWVGFTEQFKASNEDAKAKRDADILLWYLTRLQRRAEVRESQHIVEFFAPSKEIAKMLNDLAQFISAEKREAFIKKFKQINSSRWIENGWHRYIKQSKHWKDAVQPFELEVKDYLDEQQSYLNGIEAMLKVVAEPALDSEWQKMKKNILSYNKYAQEKILPVARKNISVSGEWYQNYLDKHGIEIAPEELADIAEKDFQITLKEYRRLAQVIAKDAKYPSPIPKDVIKQFDTQGLTKWVDVEKRYREAESFIADVITKNALMTLPEKPLQIRPATPAEGALIPAPTVIVPPDPQQEPTYVVPVLPGGVFPPSQTHPYVIYSLLAHEGRPGHDQQVRMMFKEKPSLAVAFYAGEASAFNEGWALYAEELIYSRFDNPTKLYALMYRLLRMARAFIDPKLHLGEMKPDAAEKILSDDIGLPPEHVKAELRRYMYLFPGQAAAYYAGYLSFKRMRQNFEKEWGQKFQDACYHDALLRLGGQPFKQLEDTLRQQKPCG